jgi:hypothetical protein
MIEEKEARGAKGGVQDAAVLENGWDHCVQHRIRHDSDRAYIQQACVPHSRHHSDDRQL